MSLDALVEGGAGVSKRRSVLGDPRERWRLSLVLCCVAAAIWAGFAPLADPDLPMHLTVGEWIHQHHAVPTVEPFAWTRAGDPYFAYSWIAQWTFFVTMQAAGPVGLHLLTGLLGTAIVLAGAAAGRAFGLDAFQSTVFGALSIVVAMESTPFLRPQLFMHVLMPLAWALTFRIFYGRGHRQFGSAVLLWIVSAASAGVHISFLVVAAPVTVGLVRATRHSARNVGIAALAIALGWLSSPYALVWPRVLALNLSYNATSAATGELNPGFAVGPLIGATLALLPFLSGARAVPARERAMYAALWLAGLIVFAKFFKGLGPWWWCASPLAALALSRLPTTSDERVRRAWNILLPLALLAFSPTNIRLWHALRPYEQGTHRMLPSLKSFAAEPLVRWLENNAEVPQGTHVLTSFNYGSYVKWRLPSISESIDSRGIFPDSVALPEVPTTSKTRSLGPWRSSALAILPESFPVTDVLDRDPAWRKIAVAAGVPWAPDAPRVALWARRDWIAQQARGIVPDTVIQLGIPSNAER